MPTPDLLRLFVAPLELLGARYMVTGSVASILYGEPRLTHDVDLVVALAAAQVKTLVAAFALPDYYCPPEEALAVELAREQRGHFNLIHLATGLKADLYLAARDPLHLWALPRRRRMKVDGLTIWVAPPEYVIVRKLLFFREGGSEKHLRDIRAMLACSRDRLDEGQLQTWIERLGLGPEWKRAQQGGT